MKLQFIASATLFALIASSPAGKPRYQVPESQIQNSKDNLTLPTSVRNKKDVINLLNVLTQKHKDDVIGLATTESAEYREVLEKLKIQIEQGQNHAQKVHNVKLVLINNAHVFDMTKREMINFIRDNQAKIDVLAGNVQITNINLILKDTVNSNISKLKEEIGARLDEIPDQGIKDLAKKLLKTGEDLIENNEDVKAQIDENGDLSLEEVGGNLVDLGMDWLNTKFNLEETKDNLTNLAEQHLNTNNSN